MALLISTDTAYIAAATALFVLLLARLSAARTAPRLPPGPTGLPFFGNVFQLPTKNEWLAYIAWSRQYGAIFTVRVFGTPYIVLNSAKAITDLFDARSAIYSDRPHLVMANELMGFDKAVVMMRYGERFRAYRRLLKTGLSPGATQKYWPLQERETALYLQRLLAAPQDFVTNFRKTAGTIALKIAYGYDGVADDHRVVAATEKALEMFSLAALPGVFLVDVIPILKHVPPWVPGAGFRRLGLQTRALVREMIDVPFEMVKRAKGLGTAEPSFTSDLLDVDEAERSADEEIKWTAGGLYAGQADTTVSAMSTFFLAMLLHPAVQTKAQAEIDAVVGPARLPAIADIPALPYVDSVLKEVLRWNPVVTMVAHAVIQDDVYEGFAIPAGTPLISNIWAALHDEAVYRAPAEFRPERFLPPESAPSSFAYAFGFGRRTCPGMAVAHASVFVAVARTLAAFDIAKARDAAGREVEPELAYSSGVVSHPKPFKCSITPRSALKVSLIEKAVAEGSA